MPRAEVCPAFGLLQEPKLVPCIKSPRPGIFREQGLQECVACRNTQFRNPPKSSALAPVVDRLKFQLEITTGSTRFDPAWSHDTDTTRLKSASAVGSLASLRSGHLRERQTVRIDIVLLVTTLVGTPAGVLLNSEDIIAYRILLARKYFR